MKEIEIRHKVDLAAALRVAQKLPTMGYRCIILGSKERTDFFDNEAADLCCAKEYLRLTEGEDFALLTFKGCMKGNPHLAGFKVREEIETRVSNVDATRNILSRLGYENIGGYSLVRNLYKHTGQGVTIAIDVTENGVFIEIEGQSIEQVESITRSLGIYCYPVEGRSYYSILRSHVGNTGARCCEN